MEKACWRLKFEYKELVFVEINTHNFNHTKVNNDAIAFVLFSFSFVQTIQVILLKLFSCFFSFFFLLQEWKY